MKIAVLAGGLSPERDVSLSSGSLIANALMSRGYEVALADLYFGAEAPDFRSTQRGSAPYHYEIPGQEPDLEEVKRRNGGRSQWIGDGILALCQAADVVFLALHGAMGENGQVQALLDCYAVPYTGSGYAGSLLAMEKGLTKQLLWQNGIPTPEFVLWKEGMPLPEFPLPCVVKPCACGSSVGVSMVDTRQALAEAIQLAGAYGGEVLIEKRITGREFSVGILDAQPLPAIEILPVEGFYDYFNKYQPGRTRELCPAPLTPKQERELRQLALKVHQVLRLGSYSRVDFLLDAVTGEFTCLEANTLPGMTPLSLLPQEAAQAGISYEELCERIVRLALKET